MSIGNFKETNETSEVNETRENTDNTEKPRNQILETPESYEDDFDSKLDNNERNGESTNEHSEKGNESSGEKTSLFDKMRNLFSKKESSDDGDESTSDETRESAEGDDDRRSSFLDDLRRGAPSMEEQAERAKELPGREDYLDAREKSEQAKRDYPDLKDWELSPEQLSEVRQGQADVADNGADGESEHTESTADEGRTPGGDAWKRRFGNVEGDD